MLQFFYLSGAYFMLQIANKPAQFGKQKNWRMGKREVSGWLGFLASAALASLFHGLGLAVFFAGFLFLLLVNFRAFIKWLLLAIPLFFVARWFFEAELLSALSGLGRVNNLYYYRVFLTHNYLFLTLLAGLGWLFFLSRSNLPWRDLPGDSKVFWLFTIFLGTQAFIVSFLLGQPFTRYFYPVFGFLIILAVEGIAQLAKLAQALGSKFQEIKTGLALAAIFAVLLFSLKGKISFLPRAVYSLNADMQEVPEVDWKKIYGFVGQKLEQNPQAILVTNWNDLPVWYIGERVGNLYIARKHYPNAPAIDALSSRPIVYSLAEFKKLIWQNSQGIVVFDSWDNRVPKGIREYARDNLGKELEVDRLYSRQPRYWPVNIYSWGMK